MAFYVDDDGEYDGNYYDYDDNDESEEEVEVSAWFLAAAKALCVRGTGSDSYDNVNYLEYAHLADVLAANKVLTRLTLSHVWIDWEDDDDGFELFKVLAADTVIETADLSDCNFEWRLSFGLSKVLNDNATLEYLDASQNQMYQDYDYCDGPFEFAQALSKNKALLCPKRRKTAK